MDPKPTLESLFHTIPDELLSRIIIFGSEYDVGRSEYGAKLECGPAGKPVPSPICRCRVPRVSTVVFDNSCA